MSQIDQIIDDYVNHNSKEMCVALLQAIAPTENGGLAHKIDLKRMIDMDGWSYNAESKTITLDTSYFMGDMSTHSMATHLRNALQTKILGTRASLASRIGWGTVNVVFGVVETSVGLIGIIVPEPGTTVAGVAVFTLGVNSIVDGFTQLAGVNQGNGFNPLATGASALGANIAKATGHERELGESIGRNVFAVTSIAMGAAGSIRILSAPGKSIFRAGVGGRPGGISVGRVNLMYRSERARDGITIIDINNNANQSILRFVTHSGRLNVNGRIVYMEQIMRHETSPKAILKGLLKLCAHGAKTGL